ncbi:predicted protein [Postia placenta Mad-698-R]|nr:predicted protein [Postia placenta Mad-698-R]
MSRMDSGRYGKSGSVEVGPEKVEGETRIRRNGLTADKLVTQPWEGIDTVYDVLLYAARTHGTKDSYGTRDIIDVHEEVKEVKKTVGGKEVTEKKTWKYFQLSDYKYLSFIQVKDAALEVAAGFLQLGVAKSDVVNVYAGTSANWQLVSYGCAAIGTPIATAYETLGESGLQHALNEPECIAMFTNADLLKVVANVAANVPSLQFVIHDGTADPSVHTLEHKSVGPASNTTMADLCKDDRVRELILKECNAIGKKNGFKQMELLQAVILTADEWTPESGLVTAAQKIQRRKIAERYAQEIKDTYKF